MSTPTVVPQPKHWQVTRSMQAVTVASLLLAVVFAVSAGGKALKPRMFERALENPYPVAWLEGPNLVVFGAANCEPCRELVAALIATDLRRFEGRVAFVERPDAATPLSSSAQIDAQFIIDRDGARATAFDTNVTPHTFVLQHRQIAAQEIGADIGEILGLRQGATE